jgi:serine/threonine-protein kinase HipA
MMPLSNEIYSFRELREQSQNGLPGLLADSLPDRFGNKLIDDWLQINGRQVGSLNPVEKLLFEGSRGMGALEYRPAFNTGTMESIPIAVDKLAELAADVVNKKKELSANLIKHPTDALLSLIQIGSSAGGARAKAVIAYNPSTGEMRSGQTTVPDGFEHWIIKFDGMKDQDLGDPDGYGKIEFAYYLMASKANIKMMPCELLKENSRTHFMTKRFDRLPGNEKIHIQSLNALQHYDHRAENKYSYEQVFSTILQLRLDHEHVQEMYRRMVFNILARNQDDHTKNLSFMMNKEGSWRLSPAYDMVYQYDPNGKWAKVHQLSANGKRDNFTLADLENVADKFEIYKAKEIRNQVADAVAMWPKLAQDVGIKSEIINEIKSKQRLNIMEKIRS